MKAIVNWILTKVNLKWSVRFVIIEPVEIKRMKFGIDIQGVTNTWAILKVEAFNGAWMVEAYTQVL